MKRIGSYFFIVLAMIFFIACEESVVEENGSQGPSTETPIQKDTLKPGKIVTVTSTDFSLGNGIDDPYDSLFINFDGKIIESTTPHYEWTTYDGYYYPENRVILNDTTLVLIFDGHQADSFGQENDYSFTVTSEDGTVCPVRISIPFFHHYFDIEEAWWIDRYSFYNDYREILYIAEQKFTRIDCLTGQVIQKYDLSGIPEELNKFSVNPYNGLIYLWYVNPVSYASPNIYVLDPESGEVRLALSVPEDETAIYQYIEPTDIAFTKYGTGVLRLKSYIASTDRVKIVRTSDDGTLEIEDPDHYPDDYDTEYTISHLIDYFVPGWDGTYIYCVSEHSILANYLIFDGENCSFYYGPQGYDHKLYVIPNKLNGSVYMRELYHQFLVSADGVTGPFSYLDSRHAGGADFCYTPGYEHLVVVMEQVEFQGDPASVWIIDTTTGLPVFKKRMIRNVDGFQATPDGKYAVAFRYWVGQNNVEHIRFYVYDMPALLSRIRF